MPSLLDQLLSEVDFLAGCWSSPSKPDFGVYCVLAGKVACSHHWSASVLGSLNAASSVSVINIRNQTKNVLTN